MELIKANWRKLGASCGLLLLGISSANELASYIASSNEPVADIAQKAQDFYQKKNDLFSD